MGRQLQVLMSGDDEASFLSFLRSQADIQLVESFAPDIDSLFVTALNTERDGHWSYSLWNKEFSWTPLFGTVGERSHDPRHVGWRYVANRHAAPLLEFTRSEPTAANAGRIYWAKDFSAPGGLSYDVPAFSAWVDTIWRWVRRVGAKDRSISLEPYVFPGARALRNSAPVPTVGRDA
jgi:hypothetical protein